MNDQRHWMGRWAAYVVLAATVNVIWVADLRGGIEIAEVATFAVVALAVESVLERSRRRRARSAPDSLAPECAGPHSVTVYRCNGEARTVETCSPLGVELEQHLAEHRAAVLADAEANGCL